MGCDDSLANMNIRLSSGWPLMPTEIENTVCRAQVQHTPATSHATNLRILNKCTLNAFCGIWGLCGTTAKIRTSQSHQQVHLELPLYGRMGVFPTAVRTLSLTQIYSFAYIEDFSSPDRAWPCMSISMVNTTSYTHLLYLRHHQHGQYHERRRNQSPNTVLFCAYGSKTNPEYRRLGLLHEPIHVQHLSRSTN